jgi:hypothetical protein
MSRRRPASLVVLASLALCTLGNGVAAAESPPPMRPMQVRWVGAAPQLSFSADDFVTAKVAEKLNGGLPQRIVTRVYAYLEGEDDPITATALSCRVVYDLWEGLYRVQVQTEQSDRSAAVADLRAVMRTCLDVRSLSLGSTERFARYRGKRVYFAALLELNPLSRDTVQRIRRWLSKSGDGQLRGDAFFGSFVSIFVSRRMGSAEHSLTFRSEAFTVPP